MFRTIGKELKVKYSKTKPTRLREEYKIRESLKALLPCYSLRRNKAAKLPLIIKLYIFVKVITKNEEILTRMM